jgi:hypothetical protein
MQVLDSLKEKKSEDLRVLSIVAEKDRTIRNLKRNMEDVKSVSRLTLFSAPLIPLLEYEHGE